MIEPLFVNRFFVFLKFRPEFRRRGLRDSAKIIPNPPGLEIPAHLVIDGLLRDANRRGQFRFAEPSLQENYFSVNGVLIHVVNSIRGVLCVVP